MSRWGRGPRYIRPTRVVFLAMALALGVTGFTLSALILAGGSVLLHVWDREDEA